MTTADADGGFQFGGGTIIPSDVSLLILDCFETLVEMTGRSYVARKGITDFIDHYQQRGVPMVVLSDGEQGSVEAAIGQAGLAGRFAAVVGAPLSLRQHEDGRVLKRLDTVVKRFAVPIEQVVFIGDSPLDGLAAQHHAVPFIRVPRSEDQTFTFVALIKGPSRYQSAEFSNVFLERYLKRRP